MHWPTKKHSGREYESAEAPSVRAGLHLASWTRCRLHDDSKADGREAMPGRIPSPMLKRSLADAGNRLDVYGARRFIPAGTNDYPNQNRLHI